MLWSYRKTYIYFFVYIGLTILLYQGRFCIEYSMTCFIPFSFLLLYLYGIIRGIWNENDIHYIFANFTGMVMYILYYFLQNSGIKLIYFQRLLMIVSIVTGLATVIVYIDCFIIGTGYSRYIPVINYFQEAISVEYCSRELIYCSYLYALYQVIHNGMLKIRYVTIIAIDLIAVFYCIKLSGPILAILVLTLIFICAMSENKFGKQGIIFLGMLGILFILLKYDLIRDFVFSFFSSDDEGNAVRYKQIEYFLKSINFWGHGLGAEIPLSASGYSVETIYLNLFHKFGIWAFVYLFGIAYTFLKAYCILRRTTGDPYDVIPLACMGYSITSLGNPMLFAPPYVLAHCISLMIIQQKCMIIKDI